MNRRIAMVLYFALLATACASDPESVIVGDDAAITENAASDVVAPLDNPDGLIGITAMSRYLIEGTLWSEAELASLRGTAWVVYEYNSELTEDASLSFWWIEDRGLFIGYLDGCTSGSALLTGEKRRGKWVIETDDDPRLNCPDRPSSLFHEENWFEFQYREGELIISTDDGRLRAQHWQSTSVHDEEIGVDLEDVPTTDIPVLPLPDLEMPDVESLSEIPAVVDLPFPECASSGRAGLDPNPRSRERLAWAEVLQEPLRKLPFISGFSGGAGLYNQELFVGLSVRYGPSLDWLEEHIPPGIICLEVPPVDYYDRPDVEVTWQLPEGSEPPDPSATVVQVEIFTCKEPKVASIMYLDDGIRLLLTAPKASFGVATPAIECGQIIDIALDEPIGNRPLRAG